jgi:2'-5' RNA ligase
MTSAVIVPARLPAGLEALRRRSVADAADGVRAHLTMLYPFVPSDRLGPDVRRAIAAVAGRHAAIPYRLTGPHRWPDTIYAGVEPADPVMRLQAELAEAFPEFPIYGEPPGFAFVPHVTVAEGPAVNDPRTMDDPAWAAVPIDAVATHLEVISRDGGRWGLRWRIPLGGPIRSPRG